MSTNINTKLDETYLEILKDKIPILNNKIINLLIKYCTKQQKKLVVDEITEELKKQFKLNRPSIKFDPWLSNNNLVKNLNSDKQKYIKEHMINANGLIESIINITLYLYDNNITVNANLLLSNNKNRLIQEMNISPGKSLGLYITENIYIDNSNNKNQYLLYILLIIAQKLKNLQESYGFIHGDFHVNNIYVNIIDNDINIQFIDFGQSMINIPFKNNNYYLLISPIKLENSSYESDLKHLIDNLDTIKRKHFNNKTNYNIYKNFINFLKKSIPKNKHNDYNTDEFIQEIQLIINKNIKNEIIKNYNDENKMKNNN